MKKIFRNSLIALTFITVAKPAFSIEKSTATKIVNAAKYASEELFTKFYKIESIRTAAIRTAMAAYCLSDGSCSSQDMTVIALAMASSFTAIAYDACSTQRCKWLPKKFNIVADGIATIASCDAGWLPITGTKLEDWTRSIIGWGSTATGVISYLGSK